MNAPLLETRGIFKHFGGLAVNLDCNLAIDGGEIHALIGPNGAGKTTLIAQLAGSLKPDRGEILFEGREISHLSVDRRVQLGIARTYQITSLFPSQTVLQNLALCVQARSGSSFRFWRPVEREQSLFTEAAMVAEEIGLSHRANEPASHLSYGEQRQLEVGLAVASRPKLLLLDEPMAGVSLEESARLVDLIRRLADTTTILLVEHDMDAVFQLADRISVLVYGQIIATDIPAAIQANPSVQEAYLGSTEVSGG